MPSPLPGLPPWNSVPVHGIPLPPPSGGLSEDSKMLQHHQEPEPASSRSLPVNTDFTSAEIETYLDRISPPAEGALTETERQERRAEMKTHLESLIAAYVELGDTQEQAVARALQQFGASRSVQREWKRVTA